MQILSHQVVTNMSSGSGHLISRASNVIAYTQLGEGERAIADAAYLIMETAAAKAANHECAVEVGPKESMTFTRTVGGSYTVPLLMQGSFDVSRLATAVGSRSKGAITAIMIANAPYIRYTPSADFASGGKISLGQAAQMVVALVLGATIAYSPLVCFAIRSLPSF